VVVAPGNEALTKPDTTTSSALATAVLNANMIDYKWRTYADLPVIENVVLETPFPSNRFGAVGVGEVATSPGPSAVLMAVSNAVGAWLHEYPATPDRVLGALGKTGPKSRKGGAA